MPEPILPAGTLSHTSHGDASTSSTPLELLRAVKEVQERRISVWHEYDDAFETFLRPSTAVHAAPINGSQNNVPLATASETDFSSGRGCAGCSSTTLPLSEDLLAQILQITTQALIECGHRLRTIQTELAHSSSPELANLVDQIQAKENALLRNVVQRDQLRKTTFKPSTQQVDRADDLQQADVKVKISQFDATIDEIRSDIAQLIQEVYAESLELQH